MLAAKKQEISGRPNTEEAVKFLSLARRRIMPVASPGYNEFEYEKGDFRYVLEYVFYRRRVVGCEIVYVKGREVLREDFTTRDKDILVELLQYLWASRN